MTNEELEAQAARLRASRARLEAAHGQIPPLNEEEMDASETEIHNMLRRGRISTEEPPGTSQHAPVDILSPST